jgi:hypothetical protein
MQNSNSNAVTEAQQSTEAEVSTSSSHNAKPNVVRRLLFILACMIVGLNLGKLLGFALFKLILWLGILPALEKFFSWFVFV